MFGLVILSVYITTFSFGVLFISLIMEVLCVAQCAASVDSFSDYGQYAISQSALGHIMVSAATALSTMDFSLLPIDADAVDSPPKAGKRAERLKSPSPLKA